jgi:hypothetical protein
MEMYHNTVQDAAGNIINGAVITVTLASDDSTATIYDKNGDALANPFSSGYDRSKGETDFKAANGLYNVQVASGTTTTIEAVGLIDPGTFSTGLNSADRIKLDDIEADADVTDAANVTAAGASITNMILDDSSLVVVPETNLQSWVDGVDNALFKARGTGVTSSYVSTVSVGGTTFAQPAVNGEISSDEGYASISYAGATGITVATLSATSTYVYIDRNGALQQQTTIPTRQDKSRKVFTMRIGVNAVAETIIGFEYYNNPIGHYTNSMRDLYEYLVFQGVPFKKDQLITGRADLGFDVSAGSLLEFGGTGDIFNPNIKSFDAATNVSYNLMSRTALVSSETTLVKFWDNAGTITALGSTTLVGHRLYRFSSGNFAMQYGQGNYANMALAKAGVLSEEYVLNPALKDATFFGWWLIESTATVTNGTTLTDFKEYTIGLQGGSSSSLSGAALRGNNGSDFLDAAAVAVNLDLEIGVDVQGFSTNLNNINQGLATTDNPTFADLDLSGDLTITSISPALILKEADGTDGFNESWLVQSSDTIQIQHRNGSGSYKAQLLQLDLIATGSGGLELMKVSGPMSVGGDITPVTDNTDDLGAAGKRWDDIYATNSTIQTSDRNEKTNIELITAAEFKVATACKGLMRSFCWKSAVAEKSDDARIHFGIIAQDLQAAFAAEGLDAGRYGMFISTTWWENQTEVPAVEAEEATEDSEAIEAKDAYTRTDTFDTLAEAPENATERTRLGVRYSELLAFIIAAL